MFCFCFFYKEFLLNDMFLSPFIGSVMTDSCLIFLSVRAVLCLESLSYLT